MKPSKEELIKKYINLVYYFAKRWVKDDLVEDVVQETYLKALKKYYEFEFTTERQLKSWLLAICHNTAINMYTVNKKLVQVENIEDLHVEETEAEKWLNAEIRKEDIRSLNEKFDDLEKKDQDILRLRFYEDLSFKEISQILEISEGTAKMRCYRTLQKLKEELV